MMKTATFNLSLCVILLAGVLPGVAQQSSADASARKDAVVEHKSVFEDPKGPPHTDPFFPLTKRMPYRAQPVVVQQAPQAPKVNLVDQIIVKGVSETADGKRFALINRKTFETGESGTVQTPRGPVNIEVIEIKENSVIIKVEKDPEPKEVYLRPEP